MYTVCGQHVLGVSAGQSPGKINLETIEAVQLGDLPRLQRLVATHGAENLTEELSHALLYHAYDNRKMDIFIHLLSLSEFKRDACDCAIMRTVVLHSRPHAGLYVAELIKRGARLRCADSEGDSLLHHAVRSGNADLVRVLLEGGLDVNLQNNKGETVLHSLTLRELPDTMELWGIMIRNGVDFSIADRRVGNTGFENAILAFEGRIRELLPEEKLRQIEGALEVLFLYAFDEVAPCRVILEMMRLKLPLLDRVIDHVVDIAVEDSFFQSKFSGSLFSLDVKYLQILISRFDHVVITLLQRTNMYNFYNNPISYDCLELLIHSHLVTHLIEFFRKVSISSLIDIHYNKMYQKFRIEEEALINLIYYFLSYGTEVHEDDVEAVYNSFGNCQLFRFLLRHTEVGRSPVMKKDIWLCLHYDFSVTDIDDFYAEPHIFSWKNLRQLLYHFAHPRLKELCASKWYYNGQIMAKVQSLPDVPLLTELARNGFRKYFVERFNITSSKKFHDLLKCLPISDKHEKIITLETRLYP